MDLEKGFRGVKLPGEPRDHGPPPDRYVASTPQQPQVSIIPISSRCKTTYLHRLDKERLHLSAAGTEFSGQVIARILYPCVSSGSVTHGSAKKIRKFLSEIFRTILLELVLEQWEARIRQLAPLSPQPDLQARERLALLHRLASRQAFQILPAAWVHETTTLV